MADRRCLVPDDADHDGDDERQHHRHGEVARGLFDDARELGRDEVTGLLGDGGAEAVDLVLDVVGVRHQAVDRHGHRDGGDQCEQSEERHSAR